MGSTDWIREDYLRPLPKHRPPWPDFPDVHLGIPFGGVLCRDVPKRELLTEAEYAALLKRIEVSSVAPRKDLLGS